MIRKTLTYSGFVLASLIVVVAFVTATTYSQLGIAVFLYPVLAYFAYRLFFSKKPKGVPLATIHLPEKSAGKNKTKKLRAVRDVGIIDIEKRAFLKLIGATGLSFFFFSILGRKAEPLLLGRYAASNTGSAESLPTSNYQISEIDNGPIGFYGFTNKDGGWFIMKENPEKGTFRYIKGSSNFANNWANRENLNYDYFHKVFP